MGAMEVRVFGVLEVRHDVRRAGPDGLGGRKPKQLLELLAAARGHPVSKDSLVEHLWDTQPRHPHAALENHIWVLRRHLRALAADTEPVLAEAEAYRLDTDRVDLDLHTFDQLILAADRQPLRRARPELEQALALVRGEVFEDEPYANWASTLREHYGVQVQRVMLDAAEAALLTGDARTGVAHATRAMEREPLSERACRLRMWGLALQGERQLALRVFESFRALLLSELDLEPLPDTVAIYQQARAGTPLGPNLISSEHVIDLTDRGAPTTRPGSPATSEPASTRHPARRHSPLAGSDDNRPAPTDGVVTHSGNGNGQPR